MWSPEERAEDKYTQTGADTWGAERPRATGPLNQCYLHVGWEFKKLKKRKLAVKSHIYTFLPSSCKLVLLLLLFFLYMFLLDFILNIKQSHNLVILTPQVLSHSHIHPHIHAHTHTHTLEERGAYS